MSAGIDTTRLLLDPAGPDPATYLLAGPEGKVATFYTGGVNGKSADDTAIGNLLDASESYEPGPLVLYRGPAAVQLSPAPWVFLAVAEWGIVQAGAVGS